MQMAQLVNLSDLRVEGTSHALVVAPGPSLEKNIHLLSQPRAFFCCSSTADGILEKHGVRPDYFSKLMRLMNRKKNISQRACKEYRKSCSGRVCKPAFFKLDAKYLLDSRARGSSVSQYDEKQANYFSRAECCCTLHLFAMS